METLDTPCYAVNINKHLGPLGYTAAAAVVVVIIVVHVVAAAQCFRR